MAEKKIQLLYVDDEANNLISFKAAFRTLYQIYTAQSGPEGMEILEKKEVSIIISDQRMPQMTGVEFLEKVIEKFPDPVRILLTGFTDMTAVVDAINKGKIFHYLTKPWKEEEVINTIDRAYQQYLENKNLKLENNQLAITNEQLEFLLRQNLLS